MCFPRFFFILEELARHIDDGVSVELDLHVNMDDNLPQAITD